MHRYLANKLSSTTRSARLGLLLTVVFTLFVPSALLATTSVATTHGTRTATAHARWASRGHRAAHRARRIGRSRRSQLEAAHHGIHKGGHQGARRTGHHGARKTGHHSGRKHPTVLHPPISHRASVLVPTLLLGDSALESQSDWLRPGQAEAFRLVASTTGLTGAVHIYIDKGNAAVTLVVGVYASAGNRLGSLLTTGSAPATPAGTWTSVSVSSAELVAGQTYWLAIFGRGGTLRYRDHHQGPCPSQTSAQLGLTAMPTTWQTGTLYTDCPPSAYVTPVPLLSTPPPSLEPPAPTGPPTTEEPPSSPPPPPPPPAPPVNTTLPTISGAALEGQTLSAKAGEWSGVPTAYGYQWQRCNASGEACVNVSGATTVSYKLTSGDVGYTLRVSVTASNAGGLTSALSTGVGPVKAAPPTASFSFSPTTPATGQAVTLDGSGSTCPHGPCTYAWSDDGGPARPIPPLWPLGSGQTMQYTFANTGTKHVRLVVTDATGQEATVEHNVEVGSPPPPPPPPSAPVNTIPPSISGEAVVGQTLSAGEGAWSGSPTSYAYQWEDCNTAGEACVAISGATSSTYQLVSPDTGHTVRVMVTASNAAGSGSQPSSVTPIVSSVEEAHCTQTLKPSEPATTLESVIREAAGGETICMEEGSYPELKMLGGRGEAGRSSFVTIRPKGGAYVVLSGKLEVRYSSYERYEKLHFHAPVDLNDAPTHKGGHDYQFVDDSWENAKAGIGLEGGNPAEGGSFLKKVLIEKDYFYNAEIESHGIAGHTGECKAGEDGQMVTLGVHVEGVSVKHSTFYDAQWHYIQGASHGPEGMDVENNLFIGYDPWECAHLNIWQIYQGGENNTFKNNIIHGRGTKELPSGGHEESSVDWLQWENGAASGECSVHMKNSVVENNLVVDGNNAELWTMEGLQVEHNTVVGEHGGLNVISTTEYNHCGSGRNYTMTHNLGVEASLALGASSEGNLFDFNASTDSSANAGGSTHYDIKWRPSWITTAWNPFKEVEEGNHFPRPPAGYYIPTSLTVEAGYVGGGGP